MSDPALALQRAVYDALLNQTNAGAAVYDMVPTDARQVEVANNLFPMIVLGPGQTIGDFQDCRDGSESFLQIDIWSRRAGYPEVKTIADQVRSILHNGDETLALDGHVLELMEFRDTTYQRDSDGKTSRARMTIRALTQTESGSG